jgi:hypothetical protein
MKRLVRQSSKRASIGCWFRASPLKRARRSPCRQRWLLEFQGK